MNEKEKLISTIKKFVRQRERLMRYHGARMTMGKMDSVTKLMNTLNYYKDKNITVVAKAIIREQEHLKGILPGRSSNFYESSIKKVDEILGKCMELNKG